MQGSAVDWNRIVTRALVRECERASRENENAEAISHLLLALHKYSGKGYEAILREALTLYDECYRRGRTGHVVEVSMPGDGNELSARVRW